TSSLSEVRGRGTATTCSPCLLRGRMTSFQLDPSAQAPWATTTVLFSGNCMSQLAVDHHHPCLIGARQSNASIQPAMARPISFGESSWREWRPATVTSVCAVCWQPAGEVEIRASSDEQTGLGLYEQLGDLARRQPVRVRDRDRSHVGGL